MRKSKVCLILVLFVLAIHWLDAKPEPEPRGRKRAFSVGLLGGALAGGMIGNALAKQSARPAAQTKHVTVIEKSPPLANGCYKETIKEPLPHNPHAYVETVHLICPTVTSAPSPAAGAEPVTIAPPQLPWPNNTNASEAVPLMPQPAPFYPHLPVQGHAPNVSQHNSSAPAPAPAPAAGPPMPAGSSQLQPTAVPPPAPSNPQVIVLSKKAVYYNKKKRSSASTLSVNLLLTALTLTLVALHL